MGEDLTRAHLERAEALLRTVEPHGPFPTHEPAIGYFRTECAAILNALLDHVRCATEPPPAQDADLQTGTFGLPAYLHSTAKDKLPEVITKLKLLSEEGCDMHGDDLLPIIAALERLAASGERG